MLQPVTIGNLFFTPDAVFFKRDLFYDKKWYRINAVGTPGMASQDSFRCHNSSPCRTVNFDGIKGVD
jgi:hypothetical protein